MHDRYVEKTFLYLLTLSVLLHLAIFGLIALLPPEKTKSAQEPTMVDLTDIPEPSPAQPVSRPERKRAAEKRHRVTRETRRLTELPARPVQRSPEGVRPGTPAPPRKEQPNRVTQETEAPVTRGEGIFKPKSGEVPDRSRLFPSAGRMARLEESYRKKYGPEVENGETRFLNTDDIQFGSFLRRFETAVYGVWNYPQAALQRGIEGVTPVKITFSRNGEIVNTELLESSGSRILDDEVLRTLKQIGPIGSFPKGYTGQAFKLIAFFQYGIGGGRLR